MTSEFRNTQKSLHNNLSSFFFTPACWPEEKNRVSHWQGLYGAWQRELQPVQLRGLIFFLFFCKMEENDRRTVQSGCGDQSRNLSLQWTFTTISRLATDMWMESALRDFCLGSCDPVDCMPIKMTILSMSQCLWESWTLDRDGRRADVPFAFAFFFFMERKNIYLQT